MDAEHELSEIRIEVAYATHEKQAILALSVPAGTTVAEGIGLSAIRDEFPELEIDSAEEEVLAPTDPDIEAIKERTSEDREYQEQMDVLDQTPDDGQSGPDIDG
jgi:putative ubiquitin-RnfH superfamily antitoxin RatB of RatAB toxin-antitoxin module